MSRSCVVLSALVPLYPNNQLIGKPQIETSEDQDFGWTEDYWVFGRNEGVVESEEDNILNVSLSSK